jgi:hypothetical protein
MNKELGSPAYSPAYGSAHESECGSAHESARESERGCTRGRTRERTRAGRKRLAGFSAPLAAAMAACLLAGGIPAFAAAPGDGGIGEPAYSDAGSGGSPDASAYSDAGSGGGAGDGSAAGGFLDGVPSVQVERAAYAKLAGTVLDVKEAGGRMSIRIANENGGETDFEAGAKTVFSDQSDIIEPSAISVGDALAAYYVSPQVMTMQYPPRFDATILVKYGDGVPGGVYAGIFDKSHLATDKSLQLRVTDETGVYGADGSGYSGELTNRVLLAYSELVLESFPPQTYPNKIIVLSQLGLPLFVNGERLFAAEARVGDGGVLMIPLRAVAEALNYGVEWDGELRQARVGAAITVTIGANEYAVGRMVPRQLDAAPELHDDRTYVPISFFTDILHLGFDNDEGILAFSGELAEAVN